MKEPIYQGHCIFGPLAWVEPTRGNWRLVGVYGPLIQLPITPTEFKYEQAANDTQKGDA